MESGSNEREQHLQYVKKGTTHTNPECPLCERYGSPRQMQVSSQAMSGGYTGIGHDENPDPLTMPGWPVVAWLTFATTFLVYVREFVIRDWTQWLVYSNRLQDAIWFILTFMAVAAIIIADVLVIRQMMRCAWKAYQVRLRARKLRKDEERAEG